MWAPSQWRFHIRGLKIPFSEHTKAGSLVMPAQNINYHIFSQSPLPILPMPVCPVSFFFTHKHPKAFAFGEADLRFVLLSSCLTALRINTLFAANLSITVFWLAAHPAKWTWFGNTPTLLWVVESKPRAGTWKHAPRHAHTPRAHHDNKRHNSHLSISISTELIQRTCLFLPKVYTFFQKHIHTRMLISKGTIIM